jgi:outer membrane protein assembly factor BamB
MKHCLPLLLALLGATTLAHAENWSSWRGPEQTGVSRDRNLPDTFSIDPKAKDGNVIWRSPYGGITTPVVQNGRIFVINKVGENVSQQERVMCFDAENGKPVWEHRFNVFLTDIVADRLGWTQMVGDAETGNVYAHGTQGFLMCFNKDGKVQWQHSLTEEYGRISGYGGRITSPIVFENLLIMSVVNANWGEQTVGGTRLVAFDKRTGDVVWWSATGHRVRDTFACVPVVAKVGGQWLVITGAGDGGVHAFKARTGEKVWSYIFGGGAVNAAPVVEGDRIYAGHGEANTDSEEPGRVICLDGSKVEDGKPKLVWKVDGIKVKYASPLLHDGRLYVCNITGELFCLDTKDGKELWSHQYGNNTRGSPVWADGKIYIPELDSQFHILKPKADGCEELCAVEFRGKDVAPVELTGSPAVANGRVYFLTSEELYCIGKKDGKASDKSAAGSQEQASADAKPAHLQVVPADVALTPGQSVTFKALAYDDHGRLIGEVKADWSLAGSLPPVFPIGFPTPKPAKTKPKPPPALQGVLSETNGTTTKLTVGNAPPPAQFGRVVARAGGLSAYVRVRVAPLLPYANDFSKVPVGRTPGGWVNCQGKFAVAMMKDGTLALKKRNDAPSPLVARAHAYIGLPQLTDYTIEADMQGTKLNADLPDMGVEANRYGFHLVGNTQQLRLISWDALPRIDRTIAYEWKPDVWYRMKLTVEVKDGKAIARGKVWPREQPEPKEWTLTVEDPTPNREGAPALYGLSTGIQEKTPGTTVYYTNVKVTPNK